MTKIKSISHSLIRAWLEYQRLVGLAIEKKSTGNIHNLRIATQKLEAAIVLSKNIVDIRHPRRIVREFRDVRKSVGPVRELQVKLKGLKSSGTKQSHKKKVLLKRLEIIQEKSSHSLEEIRLRHQEKDIRSIEFKLLCREEKERPGVLRDILVDLLIKKRAKLCAELETFSQFKLDELHHLRMKIKRFRYMKEVFNSIAGLGQDDICELVKVQRNLGVILDSKELDRSEIKKLIKFANQSLTRLVLTSQ